MRLALTTAHGNAAEPAGLPGHQRPTDAAGQEGGLLGRVPLHSITLPEAWPSGARLDSSTTTGPRLLGSCTELEDAAREGMPTRSQPVPDACMVGFRAMRFLRCPAGQWGGRLSSVVLLLGLCGAVAVPQDAVWCRGSAGHSALESRWSGCCAPSPGGEICVASPALAGPGIGLELQATSTVQCTDLWIGVPEALSSTHAVHQQPLTLAPALPVPLFTEAPGCALDASASLPHLRQVRELISATVLTI